MMPMTAILKADGTDVTGDDYVIGALTQDYSQNLGESQLVGGRYMLNIAGNGGWWDRVRFVAYQRSTKTFFDLNETIYFEADQRGSLKSPYELTLGAECQSVSSALTDINADATGIYSLQGVKLADGALRKGIYVRGGSKVVIK